MEARERPLEIQRASKSSGQQDQTQSDMSVEKPKSRNGNGTERGERGKDDGTLGSGRKGGEVGDDVGGTSQTVKCTGPNVAIGNKRKASKNGSDSER